MDEKRKILISQRNFCLFILWFICRRNIDKVINFLINMLLSIGQASLDAKKIEDCFVKYCLLK